MFTPLLKENSMKHIDYKTFNSIQAVANPATESRYNFLQTKVADLVNNLAHSDLESMELISDH